MTATAIGVSELRLPEAVATLERTPSPTRRVLSVYLDTSPARVNVQAHVLAYRDAIRALRPMHDANEQVPFEVVRTTSAEDLAVQLGNARSVISVLAYGLAVAEAQPTLPRPSSASCWTMRASHAHELTRH